MQSAYLDYAMSVIVSRALPDVRDGLKPVHRRILYAMHDMGLRPGKAYKKSARIVGEVLGKYHPHGDAAVYEAMARMAQDFSLRYTLVDGQGNFGSIDGDSPAAMRYTEARPAAIADELLSDIDKETVDFLLNFDGTLSEPAVLPAVLPNLLVNGAAGIAVGMTTNIPPHNLGEVCEALIYLIDHHEERDDVTVEDLTRFIKGPDFPTGGLVYRLAGTSDDGDQQDLIRNAYAIGRGKLKVQAHVHLEEMSRSRQRIVVTELPYQVNKTRLIERIAELVREGKIEGIADLRDESDRQGMRICIELTRTVEARHVLLNLFRLTPMQATFSLAILALVDGEPRLLPLKRVLTHYLEHRQQVITRRSRHLLDRARMRAHILEGLLRALDYIDDVIEAIRSSPTAEAAREGLVQRFRLSDAQAQAILDMPLKRLAGLERRKIADEYQERLRETEYLEGLLDSPDKIRAVIRTELLQLKAEHGDARRTRIVDREMGHHTARDLVDARDVLVTVWTDGQVSRTPRMPDFLAESIPLVQSWGNTQDSLVLFAASGRAVQFPLHQLQAEQETAASSLSDLEFSERLVGAGIVPQAGEDGVLHPSYLTLVTRGGRIKRIAVADAAALSRSPVTAMSIEKGDELGWVLETSGQDQILLATRSGKAIRFSEQEVRPMGLPAAGVLAIKLGEGDAIVGAAVARDDTFLVLFTERGYAKRTAVAHFPTRKRYGAGIQAFKLTSKTGPVAVATLAGQDDSIVMASAKQTMIRFPTKAVQLQGRAASGSVRQQDIREPFLDPLDDGPPVLLTVLASPKPGTHPSGPAVPVPEPKPSKERPKASEAKPRAESPSDKQSSRSSAEEPAKSERAPGSAQVPATPQPHTTRPAKPAKRQGPKRGLVRSVPKS
jgi:DNA gyrase subunit A